MYLITLCVILTIWYLISYWNWKKNIYDRVKKIPGPLRLPIVGTKYKLLGMTRENFFSTTKQFVSDNAPIFCTWNGSSPEIGIVKAEYFEAVMNNSTHIKKATLYNFFQPWLGEGLLTSAGSKWHEHRRLLTPAFHFQILENFMEIFVDKSQLLLKILDSKSGGEHFNIYPHVTDCTLDIICETAMGVPVNAMLNTDNNYVKSVYKMSELILWRLVGLNIPDFIFQCLPQGQIFQENLDVLHGFSQKVIVERKEVLRNKSKKEKESADDLILGRKKRLSLLDLLLEASKDGQYLSDKEIREEVDTFMFGGHDTTATGICWSLFLLGNHSDIQEQVFAEVRAVLQGKSTPTSLSELNDLKYLEQVIKESLRLYPSVPIIGRELQQDLKLGEHNIPSGTQVSLHIHALHRLPAYFPDPDKFDPDRFLAENSQGRHPFAYVPFSAGPRNCIGQKFAMFEEKTILASIINRYKVSALETEKSMIVTSDLVLRPLKGFILKLERRK